MNIYGIKALYIEEDLKSLFKQKLKFTLILEIISPKLGFNPTINLTLPSILYYILLLKKLLIIL